MPEINEDPKEAWSQNGERIMKNWGVEFVGLNALKERRLTGVGLKVTVIDPFAEKRYISRFTYVRGEKAPKVHGYGIAAFIKTILPDCNVDLIGVTKPQELDYEITQAVKRGTDVINLSMGRPTEPSEELRKRTFGRIVDRAVKGKPSQDFERDLKEYREMERATMTARMSHTYLEKAMKLAEEKGVTVVGASGYSDHRLEDTFAVYPNVIVAGGFDKDFKPISGVLNGRIDIYAPGEKIEVPAGAGQTDYMSYHSIAAPFITIASLITRSFVGKDPKRIKETILNTSRNVNGMKTVDFNFLMKILEGKIFDKSK